MTDKIAVIGMGQMGSGWRAGFGSPISTSWAYDVNADQRAQACARKAFAWRRASPKRLRQRRSS